MNGFDLFYEFTILPNNRSSILYYFWPGGYKITDTQEKKTSNDIIRFCS
jgi:hypothetical protein